LPAPLKAGVTRVRSAWWLVKSRGRLDSGGLRILFYHRVADDDDPLAVSPRRFRQQMELLATEGFRVVGLAETVALIRAALQFSGEALSAEEIARRALTIAAHAPSPRMNTRASTTSRRRPPCRTMRKRRKTPNRASGSRTTKVAADQLVKRGVDLCRAGVEAARQSALPGQAPPGLVVYEVGSDPVGENRMRCSGGHRAVSTGETAGAGTRSCTVLPVSHRIPPAGARICRQRGPRPVRWRR